LKTNLEKRIKLNNIKPELFKNLKSRINNNIIKNQFVKIVDFRNKNETNDYEETKKS